MTRRIRAYVPFVAIAVVALTAAWLTANPTGLESDLRDLGNSNADVRAGALSNLRKGDAAVRDKLLDELDGDYSALTKAGIADVVAGLGVGSSHAGVLRTCLESRDSATRQGAVLILARGKKGALCPLALLQIAEDEEEAAALRCGALAALATAGPQARNGIRTATTARSPASVRDAALRALAACSEAGARDVLKVVQDPKRDQAERVQAIGALAHTDSKGPGLLKPHAQAPQVWLRLAVLDALGSMQHGFYATEMLAGLVDANADVRLAGLRGLVTGGQEKTQRVYIRPLMNDADPRVQGLAARSTGRSSGDIAGTVRGALIGILASANFHVRYEAALALFAHGDKGGLGQMQIDSGDLNASVATQAQYAVNKINGLVK